MSEVERIKDLVINALDGMKAVDMEVIDVRGRSNVADYMVIVSGTSDRHVKAMAGSLVDEAKKAGYRPLGVEGEKDGEWVLVDLGDVIAHVMLPASRDFYQLEKLWQTDFKEGDQSAEG